MLDKETKNKIDDLRQILVGKITDPRSQVEQITNALLYKFMDDMDEDSISLGGVPSYFVNEYKKYSWKILLNEKTSGEERVKIYAEAIEKMYFNENLPQTFREIFKNSTLPFKEAKVFNKFITRINDFKYSNSESLGDAFEYLLSFMGKQGDAGQFRTPRHIIDFLVELINPEKKDKILDPASGTAGFLISAYKHILNQNKKKTPGDLLNADDRKNIANNLNGYDISPEFLKVSLMNMFLHKFNNPNIFEYDTLSDDNKWNEYFDIILANPPFFSPKGGITPHNRFSIKSKRAEVLFTDYIDEHLKPNGRAGIIVPEGVIFRNDVGYKSLRIKLIKNSLIGVISLPAGIFEPYSRVKTSILILDKKQKKKVDYIFFGKINNDGFSLTTNRSPIDKNDIPDIKSRIKKLDFSDEKKLKKIKIDQIIEGNIREHIAEIIENKSIYDFKTLGEVADVKSGNPAPQDKKLFSNGEFPFIRTSDVGIIKEGSIYSSRDYLNLEGIKNLKKFSKGSILFPKSGASTLLNHRVIMEIDGYVSSHLAVIKGNKEKVLDKYLFYLLKKVDSKDLVANPSYPSLNLDEIEKIEVPIPDLITQNQIVEELDGYQKIIDGCRQVIENYKPSIDVDPSWELFELKEICEKITDGSHNPPKEKIGSENYMLSSKNIFNNQLNFKKPREISLDDFKIENKRTDVKEGDILLTIVGTIGRSLVVEKNNNFTLQRSVAVIKVKKDIVNPYFINFILQTNHYQKILNDGAHGVAQQGIYLKSIGSIKFPLPSLEVQNSITNKIKNEIELVEKNKLISSIFEVKIKNKIDKIWSN
jgi:type I restriction enzyme M protein